MSIDVTPQTTRSLTEVVAEEIRVVLTRRRMRQSQLARQMGVTEQWLSVRLRGIQPIDLNDLQRIATTLEVDVIDLLPRGEPSPWKTSPADRPIPAAPPAPVPNVVPRPSDRRPVGHPVSRRPPAGPGRTSRVRPIAA